MESLTGFMKVSNKDKKKTEKISSCENWLIDQSKDILDILKHSSFFNS